MARSCGRLAINTDETHDEQELDRQERAEGASAADPRKDAKPGPEGRHPGGQPRREEEEQAAGED